MKHLILIVLFSLVASVMGFGQGDSYYYKYQQQKLLRKDNSRVSVKFANARTLQTVQNTLAATGGFDLAKTKEVGVGVFTLTLQQGISSREATDRLLVTQGIVSVQPIYITKDEGAELYLADEICVQFQNSASPQEIDRVIKTHKLTVRRKLDVEPYYLFSVSRGTDVLEVANQIALERNILFSHPDFYTDALIKLYVPNDRWFDRQFNLYNHGQRTRWGFGTPGADIKMIQAWDITRGSAAILVSVLDDGLDLTHEDFSPGKIVPGYDFANSDPNVQPIGTNAHGTNTAGAIAADHNTIGNAGISPNSRLQMMKIFTDAGGGTTADNLARAIDSARSSGADILSNSWGYSTSDTNLVPAVRQAILRAKTLGRSGKGCVIAFAAGNTANRPGNVGIITFPGSMSEVITVGASDRNDQVAFYSPNSNPAGNLYIELTAPSHRAYDTQVSTEGFEFWSTDISGSAGYNTGTTDTLAGDVAGHYDGSMGGTSASCPQVAGAAALILAVNPNLTSDQVTNILTSSADTVGGYNYNAIPGRPRASLQLGYGRMNVYRALVQSGANFGWVKGTITNLSGGAALAGVLVDFINPIPQASGTSTATGLYYAAAQVDSPGNTRNVTLRARKFGFIDTTLAITITRNDTLTRNFQMRPAPGGTLSVFSHTATANLRSYVEVKFGTQTVISDSTNATTGLLVAPLPVGTYSVRVDAPSPYATKTFPAVIITNGATTNVDALTASVLTFNPTSVRDTLPVGGSRTKNLAITNTTPDTVRFSISDDNALFRMRTIGVDLPVYKPIKREKGVPDPIDIERTDSPTRRGGPDGFGYQYVDSDEPDGPVFNWIDISTTGTALDSASAWNATGTNRRGDEGWVAVRLPFPFPYFGVAKDSIYIGTNGNVMFQPPTADIFTNAQFPTAGGSVDNHIGLFWDDLEVRAGAKVYYGSNSGNFVVQYQGMARFSGTVQNYTFEIILSPTGQWTTQYLAMGINGGALNSATIGWENATGTVGLSVVHNAAYMHNNLAIRFFRPDAPWISESPLSGAIPPSGNQNVGIMFDATGLTPGTNYNANLKIDAIHPDVASAYNVPASLRVLAADSAVMSLRKVSVVFPATQVNTTRRDTNWARNVGSLTLNISSITSTSARYVVTPASGTVVAGDSLRIVVAYTPTAVGTDTGRVIILSNSQGNPRRDVTLTGTAIGAPSITVSTTTIADTLQIGQSHAKTFNITNSTPVPTTPLYVSITDSATWLTVAPASDTLTGSQTKIYNTTFNATGLVVGTYTTNIRISSNDPANPLRIVAATLRVTGGPVISTRPDSIQKTLALGTSGVDSFYIKNTGLSALTWSISEAPGEAPDMSNVRPKFYAAQPPLPKGMDYPVTDSPDTSGGPDAFGYRFIDSDSPGGPVFSWIDISATGTALDTNSAWIATGTNRRNDEGWIAVPLPFSFNYYGVNKDSLYIGTNGNVMFQPPTADIFTNATFPTAGGSIDNHIGIFWDDLEVRAGARVYYGTSAGKFVVQYQGMPRFNSNIPGYTFEVVLSPTGEILTQYLSMGQNAQILNSASIGIENATGTVGLVALFNTAPPNYMHNNLAIRFSRGVSWLDETPTSGSVNPGDSAKVRLDFNTVGLTAGSYRGIVSITSNDFARNPKNFPVNLTVTGGPPTITVTSPNGGENWPVGSVQQITWNQNGVDSVRIEYSTTGRTGTYTQITAGVPARPSTWIHPKGLSHPIEGSSFDSDAGTFNWTIPNTPSTNCFVRIVRKSTGTPGDTSNAAFTISAPSGDTSWVVQPSGSTSTFYGVKAVSNNVAWVAGTLGTVLRTTNGGTNWTPAGGGPIGTADIYAIEALDANTAFVTTSPAATFIYRTTNGGTLWTQVYTLAGGFINSIIMTSPTTGYAVGDPVGAVWTIIRTTDGGATWSPVTPALPQVGTEAGWNNSFAIVGNNMWFGTNSSKVYRSTDLGLTWTSGATTTASSYGLAFNNATQGVTVSATGVTNMTTNGGTSWSAGGAAGTGQGSGAAGIAGAEFWGTLGTNVYYTTNGGTAWSASAKNGYTGAAALWSLDMVSPVAGSTFGWAGGATGTIVRYRRIPTDVANNETVIPAVYALDQNFPNPFNPTTTIRFSLPEQSTVSLKIFNLLGQEVATLAEGDMQAAFHNVVWNGKNNAGSQVATGMYFYRLDANGVSGEKFNSLKKLILLK